MPPEGGERSHLVQAPRSRHRRRHPFQEAKVVGTQTDVKAWPILVGGEFRAARSGETIDVTNPATGEVVGHGSAGHQRGRR